MKEFVFFLKKKDYYCEEKEEYFPFCNHSVVNMHCTIAPIIVCRIHIQAKALARYPNILF